MDINFNNAWTSFQQGTQMWRRGSVGSETFTVSTRSQIVVVGNSYKLDNINPANGTESIPCPTLSGRNILFVEAGTHTLTCLSGTVEYHIDEVGSVTYTSQGFTDATINGVYRHIEGVDMDTVDWSTNLQPVDCLQITQVPYNYEIKLHVDVWSEENYDGVVILGDASEEQLDTFLDLYMNDTPDPIYCAEIAGITCYHGDTTFNGLLSGDGNSCDYTLTPGTYNILFVNDGSNMEWGNYAEYYVEYNYIGPNNTDILTLLGNTTQPNVEYFLDNNKLYIHSLEPNHRISHSELSFDDYLWNTTYEYSSNIFDNYTLLNDQSWCYFDLNNLKIGEEPYSYKFNQNINEFGTPVSECAIELTTAVNELPKRIVLHVAGDPNIVSSFVDVEGTMYGSESEYINDYSAYNSVDEYLETMYYSNYDIYQEYLPGDYVFSFTYGSGNNIKVTIAVVVQDQLLGVIKQEYYNGYWQGRGDGRFNLMSFLQNPDCPTDHNEIHVYMQFEETQVSSETYENSVRFYGTKILPTGAPESFNGENFIIPVTINGNRLMYDVIDSYETYTTSSDQIRQIFSLGLTDLLTIDYTNGNHSRINRIEFNTSIPACTVAGYNIPETNNFTAFYQRDNKIFLLANLVVIDMVIYYDVDPYINIIDNKQSNIVWGTGHNINNFNYTPRCEYWDFNCYTLYDVPAGASYDTSYKVTNTTHLNYGDTIYCYYSGRLDCRCSRISGYFNYPQIDPYGGTVLPELAYSCEYVYDDGRTKTYFGEGLVESFYTNNIASGWTLNNGTITAEPNTTGSHKQGVIELSLSNINRSFELNIPPSVYASFNTALNNDYPIPFTVTETGLNPNTESGTIYAIPQSIRINYTQQGDRYVINNAQLKVNYLVDEPRLADKIFHDPSTNKDVTSYYIVDKVIRQLSTIDLNITCNIDYITLNGDVATPHFTDNGDLLNITITNLSDYNLRYIYNGKIIDYIHVNLSSLNGSYYFNENTLLANGGTYTVFGAQASTNITGRTLTTTAIQYAQNFTYYKVNFDDSRFTDIPANGGAASPIIQLTVTEVTPDNQEIPHVVHYPNTEYGTWSCISTGLHNPLVNNGNCTFSMPSLGTTIQSRTNPGDVNVTFTLKDTLNGELIPSLVNNEYNERRWYSDTVPVWRDSNYVDNMSLNIVDQEMIAGSKIRIISGYTYKSGETGSSEFVFNNSDLEINDGMLKSKLGWTNPTTTVTAKLPDSIQNNPVQQEHPISRSATITHKGELSVYTDSGPVRVKEAYRRVNGEWVDAGACNQIFDVNTKYNKIVK